MTTNTERNWFNPEMYFLAILDCHDEIHKTVGNNPFAKISIDADLTDDDNEFSYEDQGLLQTDRLLFLAYLTILVLLCRDRVRENHSLENIHTPHWYCIVGMSFQLFGIACSLVHNTLYSYDGEGLKVFDVFSTIFD
jgi:hypothetical protein